MHAADLQSYNFHYCCVQSTEMWCSAADACDSIPSAGGQHFTHFTQE